MKQNRSSEPSPVNTFNANALRLAESSSCASSLMSAVVPPAAPNGGRVRSAEIEA
jgi:hypothetical protein